jgi:hypothetical protein
MFIPAFGFDKNFQYSLQIVAHFTKLHSTLINHSLRMSMFSKINTSDYCLFPITLPYFWTLRYFTILPIGRIIESLNNDDKSLIQAVNEFIQGKFAELKFVKAAVRRYARELENSEIGLTFGDLEHIISCCYNWRLLLVLS